MSEVKGEGARVPARVGGPMIAVAVAVVLVGAASTPLWDADLWWILRAGELMLRERGVPHENRFSFTAPHAAWVMHEWLFGVGYALARAAGGLAAVALVRLGFAGLSCASLVWALSREAPIGLTGALTAFALLTFAGRMESPRPVGMAVAFALASVAILFDARSRRRHVALFAAVMGVWTNAHGSFPLGVAIAAAALWEPEDRRNRAFALGAGALATLVNPYGLAMHGLVGRYVSGGAGDAVALVHARILEWWPLLRAPLRVSTPWQLAALAAVVIFWCDAARTRRWRARAALVAGLVAMTLQHSRHLELSGLLGVALAAGPLAERLGEKGATTRRAALGWVLLPAALALGVWATAAARRTEGQWADPSEDDEAMTRALASLPDGARVMVPLPYTGWAVWKGFSRVRVLYDTRNDCYPYAVLRDGFDLNDARMAPDEAARALRTLGATHAIAPCGSALARELSRWQELRQEGVFCVYGP